MLKIYCKDRKKLDKYLSFSLSSSLYRSNNLKKRVFKILQDKMKIIIRIQKLIFKNY